MTIYKALALSAFLVFARAQLAGAQCAPACGPCEVCDTGTNTCVVPTSLGCQAAFSTKSTVTIQKGLVASKDIITWKWASSAAITNQDYGNPLDATDLTLCVHDNAGGAPHLLVSSTAPHKSLCHLGSCWIVGSFGWRYIDKSAENSGLLKMLLKPGVARQAKINVKGDGYKLNLQPPAYTTPVTVRLLRSDSPLCWEATFTDPIKNLPTKFKARSQ